MHELDSIVRFSRDHHTGARTRELLTFELSGNSFGLAAADAVEIVRVVWITPVPNAPPIVEGVINVRGALIPVVDLRRRLGLPAAPINANQQLIIARAAGRSVALRVDRAIALVALEPAEIDRARGVVGDADHVLGIARMESGLLVITDLERLLSADEQAVLDLATAMLRTAPALAVPSA